MAKKTKRPKPFSVLRVKKGILEDGVVGRCLAKPHAIELAGDKPLMFYVHDIVCENCAERHRDPFVLFFEDRDLQTPVASCSIPEFQSDFQITKGLN